jgi:hypothetical protein
MPNWRHSPLHRLGEGGAFIVTASTCNRERFIDTLARLTRRFGS